MVAGRNNIPSRSSGSETLRLFWFAILLQICKIWTNCHPSDGVQQGNKLWLCFAHRMFCTLLELAFLTSSWRNQRAEEKVGTKNTTARPHEDQPALGNTPPCFPHTHQGA